MEAIILAGGIGSRLQSEVKDVPKPMAPINGRPFLEYCLDYLIGAGVERVIFSIGYKSEIIQKHFGEQYRNCAISYAIEESRLGTGGAIKNAMTKVESEHVLALNGDSIFLSDLKGQMQAHLKHQADVTFALKPMRNIERYGTVNVDETHRIIKFNEKQKIDQGLINTGSYIFNTASFKNIETAEKFSIEKDFFELKSKDLKFLGFESDGYFLDIGIPSDFRKAQYEIGVFPQIDSSWSLFLDRDGVINKKIDDDYVRSLDQLELLEDATKAIAELSQVFGLIIIVTNQQGVGKGLMSADDVNKIHQYIQKEVEEKGGTIDKFYFAPQLASENSPMRKPEIGMALEAKKDFDDIDFNKSIMIGDSLSDMEFGRRAKMKTVFIDKNVKASQEEYSIESLVSFNRIIQSLIKTQ